MEGRIVCSLAPDDIAIISSAGKKSLFLNFARGFDSMNLRSSSPDFDESPFEVISQAKPASHGSKEPGYETEGRVIKRVKLKYKPIAKRRSNEVALVVSSEHVTAVNRSIEKKLERNEMERRESWMAVMQKGE